MFKLSASLVKELREKTGSGMMDCKKALAETDGDINSAIDWLRAKGLSAAAKKSNRTTAEGLVSFYIEKNKASIIEVNAETDFVSRNDMFQEFVKKVAKLSIITRGNLEGLLEQKISDNNNSVSEELTSLISTIGENMNIRRSDFIEVNKGIIASYMHSSVAEGLGKIGVLVSIEGDTSSSLITNFGKKLAMHIAASNPRFINIDNVDKETLDRERQVLTEQALDSGKPKEVIDKMVDGRIKKFFDEIVLLEQLFVLSDDKLKVRQEIANIEKELGSKIVIKNFVRFSLGEGIEREEKDFASEVAEAVK
ncbi:MAG: translation elongation factor Ts [Alphaproteobacteria bacterium TMED87]|nr:elongation factor Ts [Rhodospirillaceae bacterium]OUV09601.1 MAG: translation elongation factor Ts [Alphaproteobacteria bacterium TMED87]